MEVIKRIIFFVWGLFTASTIWMQVCDVYWWKMDYINDSLMAAHTALMVINLCAVAIVLAIWLIENWSKE